MTPYKQGVYALFDGDELVYIGQSSSILYRVGQHIREHRKKFDSYEAFPMDDATHEEVLRMEEFLIGTFSPKYNKAHSGENRKWPLPPKKDIIRDIQALIDGPGETTTEEEKPNLAAEYKAKITPPYLTHEEAAKFLGIPEDLLEEFRARGLIKWCKFGKGYTYSRKFINEFINEFVDDSLEKIKNFVRFYSEWKEE